MRPHFAVDWLVLQPPRQLPPAPLGVTELVTVTPVAAAFTVAV